MSEQKGQHGWAPDVGMGGSERATEANKKAFGDPPAGKEEGREVSEEERGGVPPTDTEAETPLGVGESSTERAEDYGSAGEPGRTSEGTKGESERPYGKTEPEGGVDRQGPVDPESPYLPPS